MAKIVKVYVVDNKLNGLSGQRVKIYGGSEQKTGKDGCATLVIESTNVTIFINGFSAYEGYSSRLDPSEVFTTTGKRP